MSTMSSSSSTTTAALAGGRWPAQQSFRQGKRRPVHLSTAILLAWQCLSHYPEALAFVPPLSSCSIQKLALAVPVPHIQSVHPTRILPKQRFFRPLNAATRTSDCNISSDLGNIASPDIIIEAAVQEFVATVTASLQNATFVSLTLKGPTDARTGNDDDDDKDPLALRGCIRQVQGRLVSLSSKKKRNGKDRLVLQTTIKYHGATDVAKNWNAASERHVAKGLRSLLLVSENDDSSEIASEWGTDAIHPCGSARGIQRGDLVTTVGTWTLRASPKQHPRVAFRAHHCGPPPVEQITAASLQHDRSKQVPLPTGAEFLQALGLSRPDGKPRPGMSSKLRQCQKFVEIVSGLVETSLTGRHGSIHTLDMGCGRGYLTFSLHSHLCDKYGSRLAVHSRGIDVRPKLVKEISGIARSIGPELDGLVFEQGSIEESSLLTGQPGEESDSSSLNVLIALHACDTATDDALWSGIQSHCDVIVAAPCCHKQVRRQLDPHVAKGKENHPLADVLCHNIYRERMAEMATDSIRALLLQLSNYNVQVFEFIGGEHTSKNVMITAVKRRRTRSKKALDELRKRLHSLLALHGVREQRLAEWMGELSPDANGAKAPTPKLSARQMPPL